MPPRTFHIYEHIERYGLPVFRGVVSVVLTQIGDDKILDEIADQAVADLGVSPINVLMIATPDEARAYEARQRAVSPFNIFPLIPARIAAAA